MKILKLIFNILFNKDYLGKYIYMGMGTCRGHIICLSIGYNLDYATKKALQFQSLLPNDIQFDSVNQVLIGQTSKMRKFTIPMLQEKYLSLFT